MKIAIVHDYLIDFGGAERVLSVLHEMYPSAPIYTLIYRKEKLGKFAESIKDAKIYESWFGRLPLADRLISPLRFLIPVIWKSFNLREYDLIISSSSWAVTKGFDKKENALEICYCHTPPRYLYGYDTSRKFSGVMGRFIALYGFFVNKFIRKYDIERAKKVDYFIANSKEVAKRITAFYKKDSTVIYPPVEVYPLSTTLTGKKNYYLTGGRLTAAKNFDLIIKAFNKLGLPLLIYGEGPLLNYLKNISKQNIQFLGEVSDEKESQLYKNAIAFVVAQKDEDFGITPVEAMAYGTPVIAYKGGGYLESIVERKTGIFFEKLSSESIIEAVKKFEKTKFNAADCINQAKKFSVSRFKKEITAFIKNA